MAKEAFYKIENGQKIKMTNREVKQYIMKQNKWTSEQYNKQYDILRNKLRAFESYERMSGKSVKTQSVQSLLYKEAKAKKREGENYKPSIKMQRIKSFTSISSGKKGLQALTHEKYVSRRTKLYEDATYKQFSGFIAGNPQARKIYESIPDPVMREKALADYADKVHAKIDEQDKAQENEAIPYGETYGSGSEIDFDITPYL